MDSINRKHLERKDFLRDRAAIYLSAPAGDGGALDQRALLRDEVHQRGWTLAAEYEDHCPDDAWGPGLQTLVKDAAEDKFDFVVVSRLDLGPDSLDTVSEFVDRLGGLDVWLLSLDDDLDTTTAEGRSFLNMHLVFALSEREQTTEWTGASTHDRARGELR